MDHDSRFSSSSPCARESTMAKPPPPARRSAHAFGGLPIQAPQFVMLQLDGLGSQSSTAGGTDATGMDLLCHRVVSPTGFALSQDLFADGTYVNVEEEISGTYFTDLMSGGFNHSQESQDFTPPSAIRHDEAPVTAKGSQGRSKNFRDEEDTMLVSAWLNVGMDPISGVDQSQLAYWKRIHEYFHTNKTFESDRTQGSLMNRWSGIQHDVNIFCGCVSRIEARNQSGYSVDDKIASACTLFKAEDKKHRYFTYMHCWKILKDKPKWLERHKQLATPKTTSNKKQKTMANSSPSAGAIVTPADGEPLERPQERRRRNSYYGNVRASK